MEEELRGWRERGYTEGMYIDTCDGEVRRTTVGPDGKLFFDPDDVDTPNHEIRIGVTMSFDWYIFPLFCFVQSVTVPLSFVVGSAEKIVYFSQVARWGRLISGRKPPSLFKACIPLLFVLKTRITFFS